MTITFDVYWKIWGLGLGVGFQDEAGFIILLGPLQITGMRGKK